MGLPIADRWFDSEPAGEGVTRLWEPNVDALLESNVWHVGGSDSDLVVDFANGLSRLSPSIARFTDGRPVIAVATHGHFDHVGGLREFVDRRCHEADAEMVRAPFPMRIRRRDFPKGTEQMYEYYGVPVPELIISALPSAGFDLDGWSAPGADPNSFLGEGDPVDLGDRRLRVLHTPGHTPGSICLFEPETGILFSGDAAYVDSRLSWEDERAFMSSLRRLGGLPVTVVHSGHGRSFGPEELQGLYSREHDG